MHRDLGIIYADAGRKDEAIRELKTALEYDPEDAETSLRLAKLSAQPGKQDNIKPENTEASKTHHASLQEMIESVEAPAPESSR
jgi:tetratricopeptide (TPR) repeat protein